MSPVLPNMNNKANDTRKGWVSPALPEKLGIIAGNRLLPLILSKSIKENFPSSYLTAICFRNETNPRVCRYVDRVYWIDVDLSRLRAIIRKENIKEWVMAGQINPLRIFRQRVVDPELSSLMGTIMDLRPHTVFTEIIKTLESEGVHFLDSTLYLKNYLASLGVMNELPVSPEIKDDIDFGTIIVSRFVELDIGQTVVIKRRVVVALEALEGTDRTIQRAFWLAGSGCSVFKFSRPNQDLRFDVPVVGIKTLRFLKKVKAKSLVLESGKVIILEKPQFLSLAKKWRIPVLGKEKVLS